MTAALAALVAPDTLRIERTLPGPIERVWSFLTESDKRRQWLASGDMELHVGGRVEHVFRNSGLTGNDTPPPAKYANFTREHVMHGRITHCEPPRVLAYTWGEGDGASHVRFELDPVDDQVRLRIVHSRLPDRGEILSVGAGWHTHVDILSDRLQGRVPAGFRATHTRLEAGYERLIPPG